MKIENVQYGLPLMSMRVFQRRRYDDRITDWHYHKELEFIYLLDGVLESYIQDEFTVMKPGDVIVIGANQLHRDRIYSDPGMEYIVLQFDIRQYFERSVMPYYRIFANPMFPLSSLNYIFAENPETRRCVGECIRDIYAESVARSEGYEMAISLLIKKMFLAILRSDVRQIINFQRDVEMIRMQPVLEYIESNLFGKIQLEEASRIANFSYYYFVKYFRKVFGMSFLEYVNLQRIRHAERMLLTSEANILQIAAEVGIPNMAHFYRMFRRHNHCSPAEFRKKRLEWGTEVKAKQPEA
jgi:AraC-like DNA-binding protein